MDPVTSPESSKMRVFPVFLAFDVQNTRVLPCKMTSESSKMAPRWGLEKGPILDTFIDPRMLDLPVFYRVKWGKMHNRNNGIMRLYRVFPYILQKCLFLQCFTV